MFAVRRHCRQCTRLQLVLASMDLEAHGSNRQGCDPCGATIGGEMCYRGRPLVETGEEEVSGVMADRESQVWFGGFYQRSAAFESSMF